MIFICIILNINNTELSEEYLLQYILFYQLWALFVGLIILTFIGHCLKLRLTLSVFKPHHHTMLTPADWRCRISISVLSSKLRTEEEIEQKQNGNHVLTSICPEIVQYMI